MYCTGSSSAPSDTLIIANFSFKYCRTSCDIKSGRVVALSISSASVSESVFYDCSCPQASAQEGAGLFMSCVSVQTLVQRCSFISCQSADDGGGSGIYYSSSAFPYVVDSCAYIGCRGTDQTGTEGGGLILCVNNPSVCCTNSLFNVCNAPFLGNGITISSYKHADQPFTFSFFHSNTSGYGNDIFYYTPYPSSAIISCSSTSYLHKICCVADINDYRDADKYEYDYYIQLTHGHSCNLK